MLYCVAVLLLVWCWERVFGFVYWVAIVGASTTMANNPVHSCLPEAPPHLPDVIEENRRPPVLGEHMRLVRRTSYLLLMMMMMMMWL